MIVGVLVGLGLAFGSFVNALVWRLRQQDKNKDLDRAQKQKISIIRGRSMCPHCGHELAWFDLMPVVSWLMLGGKCRYCSHKIEDSPLVELGMAALFVGSYMVWPYGFDSMGDVLFGFWLVFLIGFVALVVYDLKWMELPNRLVYPLIGLAIIQIVFLTIRQSTIDELIQAAWGFLVIGGLFYGLFQVSRGQWIGGGDVKLGFLIGLLVGGPSSSLMVIFLASLLGTCVSLPLLGTRSLKAANRIPFGPFLLMATVLVYLYGDRAVDFYWSFF